jgi:diguanylate cyclase (GGDEF)-like protein
VSGDVGSRDVQPAQAVQAAGEARFSAPDEFLIGSAPDDCKECWGCVRYCPARAVRVVNNHSEIITEKCVKCGLCVSECGSCGHSVRDDTPRVRELLASGRPVVAVLASEFVAAMHPMTPPEIERVLESAGFFAVETTVIGEELIALAYEPLLARAGHLPRLRSTCPVTVDWVRKFYPQLTQALVPLVPPYIAQARLVKSVYPPGTAVVYVSPCYARKDEIFESELAGAVDAAIDFTELRRFLASLPERSTPSTSTTTGTRRPQPIKELSLTDGFPRQALVSRDMTDHEVVVVRGLHALDRLLEAIVRGESAPSVIDMLNCEGCIDGPAVSPGLSVFAKRNLESAERERQPVTSVGSRALLGYLPKIGLVRSFDARPVLAARPSDASIDEELAVGEFDGRDDVLDCGACGYPTCVDHAIAVLEGSSSWEMCFPLQRRVFRRETELLEAHATIDEVTGLWNRRLFSERLSEETARSRRYGTPLSLVMLDLDDFKAVNDTWGHLTGDIVLAAVASMLCGSLRESDVPARFGGDEFAVVLPGITKTEAYVVAEKLRESFDATPITITADGETIEVRVTASLGVASAGPLVDGDLALLKAADSALYHAKACGRNQVRLAAG